MHDPSISRTIKGLLSYLPNRVVEIKDNVKLNIAVDDVTVNIQIIIEASVFDVDKNMKISEVIAVELDYDDMPLYTYERIEALSGHYPSDTKIILFRLNLSETIDLYEQYLRSLVMMDWVNDFIKNPWMYETETVLYLFHDKSLVAETGANFGITPGFASSGPNDTTMNQEEVFEESKH